MRKIWNIKKEDAAAQQHLVEKLSVPRALAQLLINRNIRDPKAAEDFLCPKLLNLHNPLLMKDMKRAVSRIRKAVSSKEKIMIYGDYDVDGITATALLRLVLERAGAKIETYIPSRMEEGYGLSSKAIPHIHKKDISLLVTVDCGITAVNEIGELNALGIDTIVTDHHNPGGELPQAYAVINPLQKDCAYPDKNLSGVGVAFKLAAALIGIDNDFLYEQLDLVCLGTVADVVPLIGENRILVKSGLEVLTHTKKKGIRALMEASYLIGKDMTSHYVAYILGPRINAAGRLGSPDLALKLLLTDDQDEAAQLAQTLNQENKNRQKIEESVLKSAIARIEREVDFKEQKVIILEDDNWHQGVIGIVASRIVDRFYRPTIMIAMDGDEGKGSCRSIKNFHLFNTLADCSDLLRNYGGHSYAAGLTLSRNRLLDFKKRINSIAQEKILPDDLVPSLNIDIDIPISELNMKMLSDLDKLGPFGIGNPKPVFSSRNLSIRTQPQILRRGGVKIWVTDGKVTAEAIGFNMADYLPSDPMNQKIDLAYNCSLHTYKGITSIQLQLKDLRLFQPSDVCAAIS